MVAPAAPRARLQGQLIDVRGLQQTYRLLGQVSPDLRRQMFREIGSMVKKRVTAAKTRMPRRTGFAAQTTLLTKSGSKASQMFTGSKVRQGMFGFQALTGASYGTILDLMAKANTTRTQNMLENLTREYGPAPRFLAREFLPSGEGGTQLWRESRDIVERYIRQANDLIDKAATTRIAG